MRCMRLVMAAGMIACLAAGAAAAQESTEDRMRDALRQAVTEMRAAQDQAAQAQADLQKAQADKQDLQKQLDAANAQVAQQSGKGTAKPAELQALQDQLKAAQAQNADLQQALAKWQGAYQTAQQLAQAKADESRVASAGLQANNTALETCKTANAKLMGVAEDILHLYESQSFRAILLKSYEPLIGSAKVRLENMVQDYDDKISAQQYVPPAAKTAR